MAGGPQGSYFAVAAPGLEGLLTSELRGLGLISADGQVTHQEFRLSAEESGGVGFEGRPEALYRANLWLRTASRVLVRMEDFYAANFPELRKKAGRLSWEKYLRPGQPVNLHVTCHKSKLYHSGAVAERVLGAISDHLGQECQMVKASQERETLEPGQSPAQMVVVRLLNDHCTISVDSSGELLHRRGYRQATAKAPLRETLAAAMLLASGWDRHAPLLDPFCGSGTIAIEAALLASGRPPGGNRRFAFMDWPGFDPGPGKERWQSVLAGIQPVAAAEMPVIQASDRDAGAIRSAQANAGRAGVAELIEFTNRAVSAIQPPSGPGWVVTNPPYGVRVSANADLRNLYAQFGNVLRAHCPGWYVAVLCNDLKLLGQMGIHLDTSFGMVNGGVNVRLARGQVTSG